MTEPYEYPISGERPSKEEQALFENMAKIIEGKKKDFLFAYYEGATLKVFCPMDEADGVHLAAKTIVHLNEKRRTH